MGILASFLDYLWPSRARDPAPQPLPKLDLSEWMRPIDLSKPAAVRQRVPGEPMPEMWHTWPPPLGTWKQSKCPRRITGSRGLAPRRGGNCTKRRPVIDDAGVRFTSIRAAARSHGLAMATVWRKLHEPGAGWRYAD